MNELRVRRSQEERSAEMKARLIESTLDCLQAHGYQGASLSVILDHAEVSRGAWAHHFDSKKALVAAAAESMFAGAVAKVGAAVDQLPTGQNRIPAMVDFLWQNFYQGRHRDVLFELATACRTDQELRERLLPVIRGFRQALRKMWGNHFIVTDPGSSSLEETMILSMFVLRGMAMQSMLESDDKEMACLRDNWSKIMTQFVVAK